MPSRSPRVLSLASLIAAHARSTYKPLSAEREAEAILAAHERSLHLGASVQVPLADVPAAFAALCWAARQVPDFALTIAGLLAGARVEEPLTWADATQRELSAAARALRVAPAAGGRRFADLAEDLAAADPGAAWLRAARA